MNLVDLAGPGRTPACWEKPDLFAASALDYDPRDEIYKDLDAAAKADLAQKKIEAEEAAVDVCFGCPVMLGCEKIDDENAANGEFIVGVIGGRTESERKARRDGRVLVTIAKTVSVPNPQIAPGDRGPRNQVDDELVGRLTNAGKTSDQIARTLNCSPRTVSRARKRMGLNTPKSEQVATDTFASRAAAATGESVARTEKATSAAPMKALRTHSHTSEVPAANPFIGGRPVSPAMEAVYNHLATVGGSDHIDTLLAVGMPHVDPAEALNWWVTHNSTTENGVKVLRSSKANTPAEDRIHEGARSKVFNSISATHRKGRYLDRTDSIYTLKAHALTAWTERMHALATSQAA